MPQELEKRDNPKLVVPGDVVQLGVTKNEKFNHCLLVVTEARQWGVMGYCKIPGQGEAYYRCSYDEITYVGPAAWVHQEDGEYNAAR